MMIPMREIKEKIALREVLYDRSFETETQSGVENLSDVLQAEISTRPSIVRSGEKVIVRLSIKNTGDLPVNLSFVAHEGPMMDLEVKGPDNDELVYPPPNPPPIARSGPPYAVGLTLYPGGEIFHEVEWLAARYQWDPGLEGPIPIPLHGYGTSVHPAGPLAPGRYSIQIYAMFHYAGHGIEEPVGLLDVTE